jgi:hypothetical protein
VLSVLFSCVAAIERIIITEGRFEGKKGKERLIGQTMKEDAREAERSRRRVERVKGGGGEKVE